MTQEDKEVLLKDLSSRLPYNVKVNFQDMENPYGLETPAVLTVYILGKFWCKTEDIRPYLRPMSSMTDEEAMEYANCGSIIANSPQMNYLIPNPNSINWLLEHHFDFMGLISKDLAIEVTESNNPYKE